MKSLNRKRRFARPMMLASAALAVAATAAWAAESIRYEYDARGRLVKAVRTDTATNTVVTTTNYTHDKADNRTKREVKSGQ
jgi:hypothetical protein